jgi:acetyl esterase/lipase
MTSPPRAALALALGLGFSACAVPTTTPSSETVTEPPTTVATTSPSTTAAPLLLEAATIPGGLPVDVYGPAQPGDWPVVVLFHGGGWYGGSPATMAPLAAEMARQGFLAYNATYRTSNGGFPESFEDVACAVRFASATASDYTEAIGPPVIIAHSAGAQLASVISLVGDSFSGSCPVAGSALPAGLVGLAGPYDVSRFSLLLASFFGTRYEDDPTPWEAGSPFTHLGENPGLRVLLIHGDADQVVPVEMSRQFATALSDAGYQVDLEILAGAGHAEAHDPELVGDLIERFLAGA